MLSGIVESEYPWGSQWPPPARAGNYGDTARGETFATTKGFKDYTDGFATTAPVMSFSANPFGLYDMGGNVHEWVNDAWNAELKERVLRGGSWESGNRQALLSSTRTRTAPERRSWGNGFRCVLDRLGRTRPQPATMTARAPATPAQTLPAPATPPPVAPAATPKPPSEIEKWLAQVAALYEPMRQKEVAAPFENGMSELTKNTLATLDREIAMASRATRLSEALVFRRERARLEAGQGVLEDDRDQPPVVLKTLREIYRKQSAQLEADRRQHLATVFGQYDKVLAANQNALTQRQRLEEALLLQQHRDAIKQEWMAPLPPKPVFADREKPFVNTLGMKFVPVAGTKIVMCIHETRRKDYAAYASEVPDLDGSWKHPVDIVSRQPLAQGDDHPVVHVSWEEAGAFCTWLSKKERRPYRLPTEREWNLAVAYDVDDRESISDADLAEKLKSQYPWGTSDSNDGPKYGNYEALADGYEGTAPVMTFLPNRLGIFDLGGNACEWCGQRILSGCGYRNHGPFRTSNTRFNCPPPSMPWRRTTLSVVYPAFAAFWTWRLRPPIGPARLRRFPRLQPRPRRRSLLRPSPQL